MLIPGLADMHAHLLSDATVPDSLAADEFMLMLANGLTSVRLMIGTPEHLTWRHRIDSESLVGPRLLLGSPQFAGRAFGDHFNGYVADSPDSVRPGVPPTRRESPAVGQEREVAYRDLQRPDDVGPKSCRSAQAIGVFPSSWSILSSHILRLPPPRARSFKPGTVSSDFV